MTIEAKRKVLNSFCEDNYLCDGCPLNTDDFTCGRGFTFYGDSPISDCEVEIAYNRIFESVPDPAANPVPESTTIKDSGDRTEFASGAVRDMHEGKGDMVSVPWEAILRLSVHYEHGAKKYERFNYRKGIPISSFIDSACRHLAKYQCGCDDEDHLAAAAFNVLGAMLMENTLPDMQDLPLRRGKRTFGHFKETV